MVSSGSESRRGGGVARASRARWEFPGAGQRERQRRVRVMRAVRTHALLLYSRYLSITHYIQLVCELSCFLSCFHTLSTLKASDASL